MSGDLRKRGSTTLDFRLRGAWAKFHAFKTTLTNKHVDSKLRLRLFDAVVTPVALYGLVASPLTQKDLSRLTSTQNKMLRMIIGWSKCNGQDWADAYRRMNSKVDAAVSRQPIRLWGCTLMAQRRITMQRADQNQTCFWVSIVSKWKPAPKRKVGRPRTRWSDNVH